MFHEKLLQQFTSTFLTIGSITSVKPSIKLKTIIISERKKRFLLREGVWQTKVHLDVSGRRTDAVFAN